MGGSGKTRTEESRADSLDGAGSVLKEVED